MTPEQEERLTRAFERIADSLALRLEKDYPAPKASKVGEVNRVSDAKKEQFSDEASPQWFDETEQATSRFAQRLQSAGEKTDPGPAKS